MKTFLAVFLLTLLLVSCSGVPEHEKNLLEGPEVKVDVAHLQEKTPEFYVVPYEGKEIRLFVVASGGEIQAYLNACLKCYPKRLGFRFEKDRVVCRACNVAYPLEELQSGIGGCYPIHLPGHAEEGRYVIDKKTLLAARKYF